jgi:hypothetical protein
MLRANILQPLTDEAMINERFKFSVNFVLKSENKGILDMLAKELCKFKNYEPHYCKVHTKSEMWTIYGQLKVILLGFFYFQECVLNFRIWRRKWTVSSIMEYFNLFQQIMKISIEKPSKIMDP